MNSEQIKTLKFFIALCCAHLFALLAPIFVLIWMIHFKHGFGWRSEPSKEFSYHPFFMILGFMFFYTQASLVYRTFPTVAKPTLKLVHFALQLTGLIFVILALVAIFDSHNLSSPPMPNMYSLHSWIGMGTVVLFCLQLVFGLVIFLFPGLPQPIRALYMPIHTYFGTAIFLLAVASSLMGILRYAGFSGNYSNFSPEGVLANCLGLDLVLLALSVTYLLNNPDCKRQPRPEDEHHIIKVNS